MKPRAISYWTMALYMVEASTPRGVLMRYRQIVRMLAEAEWAKTAKKAREGDKLSV